MTIAATGLTMGWANVSYTVGSGSAVPLDNVTEVAFPKKSDLKRFYGDAGIYAKCMVTRAKVRRVTITSGDVAKLLAIPEDTIMSCTGTLMDAKNGILAGAITFVLLNCILADDENNGKVNEFGMGTVTLEAIAVDGVTDPLTITVA